MVNLTMTQINKYSSRITQPRSQGASQAMLYATGMTREDMDKAQVGISAVWYDGNPCNMHLNKLSEKVKEGVNAAGLYGMRFNTIGVSDGISMGTDGMSYSLQSRDIIADSIETVMSGSLQNAPGKREILISGYVVFSESGYLVVPVSRLGINFGEKNFGS